jgi:hypothetical protein
VCRLYARSYLTRRALNSAGLWGHPGRVASVDIELQLPPVVPESQRDPLSAVASHCTVLHNTLVDPPAVSIGVSSASM